VKRAMWALRKGLVMALLAAVTALLGLSFWPARLAVARGAPDAAAVAVSGGGGWGTSASASIAATPSPGPVSIGFAQDMTLHHEQAIHMAQLALTQGGPSVKALAEGIVHQQLKEIGYMQGWLLLWAAPPAPATDDMPWMRQAYDQAYTQAGQREPLFERFIQRCRTDGVMPGLATPAQLEHLASLQGEAFDERFLALMISHHQAAVVMARFVAAHAESPVVRGFAASVASEQTTELPQMLTLLTAPAASGP
jgi:uncharacterized protein (DUF305 family)